MLCVGIMALARSLFTKSREIPTLPGKPIPILTMLTILFMDQNEKLAMYGLTEVSAFDGYSGKIVAFVTMPVKNNALIYENVYRYSIGQSFKNCCR